MLQAALHSGGVEVVPRRDALNLCLSVIDLSWRWKQRPSIYQFRHTLRRLLTREVAMGKPNLVACSPQHCRQQQRSVETISLSVHQDPDRPA